MGWAPNLPESDMRERRWQLRARPESCHPSVRIEGGKQRVLDGRVLDGLGQVSMHLAGGAEDTLHSCGRGGRGEVLLDHLGEVGPLDLFLLPPQEHLDVDVRLLRVGEVYCSSSWLDVTQSFRRIRPFACSMRNHEIGQSNGHC